MWFIGVLRNRLGTLEDQFFATVFLGSGLMFPGMLFVAAAALGASSLAYSEHPEARVGSATFAFAHAFTFDLMHIYAFKMAAVFIVTAATLAFHTRFIAHWIALLGDG